MISVHDFTLKVMPTIPQVGILSMYESLNSSNASVKPGLCPKTIKVETASFVAAMVLMMVLLDDS